MNGAENFLDKKLAQRASNGLMRKLTTTTLPYDFSSNDYLGFARSPILKDLISDQIQRFPNYKNGSVGSRLLTGNHLYTEETEQAIADFHEAQAGLIFNSGYDANVGLLSSIPQRGDTIITDELIHASLIDGARLSHAARYKFKHNDVNDLEHKLKIAKGLIYVVVESVYSMDGDTAPLIAINKLCQIYHAHLIVDEAHATGIFGERGKGLIHQLGITSEVFARVVTFGKAIGTHGAIILGSNTLKEYLINFSRSFIYTTAAPIHSIIAVRCAYSLLAKGDQQKQISNKINFYQQLIEESGLNVKTSPSAIQNVMFTDNQLAKEAATNLQRSGFDVRPILSPTVPLGKERLRICLHIYNSDDEITHLVAQLQQFKDTWQKDIL